MVNENQLKQDRKTIRKIFSKRSSDNYTYYKISKEKYKKDVEEGYYNDFPQHKWFYLYSQAYAALFNKNKQETIRLLKEINDYSNNTMNWLIFDINDVKVSGVVFNWKTGITTEGHSECIRQTGIQFKEYYDNLKESFKCAMMMDQKIGYWNN